MQQQRIPFVDETFDFWKLYDAGEWEPETKATLARFLTPGSEFVDIGAWIGPVTMWAGELGAHITAYEPDPTAFAQLLHNTSHLPVLYFNKAVASTAGTATLVNSRFFGDSMSRLGRVDIHTSEHITVPTVTPSDVLALTPNPALVKVDIEGGEIDVLPTLAPLCAERNIPLFVSWHEPWWTDLQAAQRRGQWFKGFNSIEGGWGGWDTLLAYNYGGHK